MSKLSSLVSILSLIFLYGAFSPVLAYAADNAVGNEVIDAADTTLTRTGAGTAANPFKLLLNLGNANSWTAAQTFNGTVTLNGTLNSNGTLNLGDGGDSATISATTVTVSANGAGNDMTFNVVDNNTDAFDVQQGTNNYLNINTGDGAETVSLGNALTNPLYFFLGNGSATFGGNINASGDVAVIGGDVTTTALTGNLFNTAATTVNVGGSATSLTFGTASGTATIRNATVSLPNATVLNALSATAFVNSLEAGGGYGSSGTTVSSSGNISTNGNLTVDGSQTLTGSLNAGSATFSPGSTSDVTVNTDADSTLILTGLTTNTGTQLCVDGADNVVKCTGAGSASDLQSSYDAGNTIATTDARNVAFTLSDTLTDSNFSVTTASGSTGYASFVRANGAGSNDPSQLVLLDNADSDRSLPAGLKVQSATGGMTTAIDVSDADIVTALSAGSNDLTATNWSLTGSTGNFSTSGDISVNGGDVVTTASTANLFNNTATTLNIGSAATTISIGSFTGTTTFNHGLSIFGALTAGSATFSPASTSDLTINTDADSTVIVNGLQTATGDALCLDASNVLVKCDTGAAALSQPAESTSLNETIRKQQEEINMLKKELELLKAKLQ